MSKSKTVRAKNVPAAQFVLAVKAAIAADRSQEDVAAELGLKGASCVATRCANLRKKGVNLPEFKRGGGGRKLDVEALNALLEG